MLRPGLALLILLAGCATAASSSPPPPRPAAPVGADRGEDTPRAAAVLDPYAVPFDLA